MIEGDRRYFARRRDRSYRVRHMAAIEMQVSRDAGQTFEPLFPGARWFTAVRQVAPGYRIRAVYQAFANADVDLSEATSCRLYVEACGPDGRRLAEALERAIHDTPGCR
ncbi:hypothetical protein [Methylobacterium sp. Leaf91]|uniref:hypothetical protein n=1 Tax=Methylobacterium sp. Leaf91 TaxID=1736247 RepID=UPI0012E78540|nr:hypothetical protein [Methylobacterium sp. Leaf91]